MMRNSTIDIAKGIGILTVVLCHNWILYNNRGELSRVVFSFHMPLFFFISGLFFKSNISFKQLLLSKFSSLLKPFFVVSIAYFIWELISVPNFSFFQGLLKLLYASGPTIPWTPLWFLSHLFLVFIFAWLFNRYFLNKITSTSIKLIILILMLFVGVQNYQLFWEKAIGFPDLNNLIFERGDILLGLPFNLDIILVTSSFFLAGQILAKKVLNFEFNTALTVIALLVFAGLHFLFNETIEINGRYYGDFIICTLQIFSGIYLVFALSSLCKHFLWLNKWLSYLGSASLFILIFHFYAQHKFIGILGYYFPEYMWYIATLGFFFSIILSIVLWELTLKHNFLRKLMLPSKQLST